MKTINISRAILRTPYGGAQREEVKNVPDLLFNFNEVEK
jgi:hypothetical protein